MRQYTSRIYYGYWLIAGAFVAQFVAFGIFSYVQGAFMTPMIEDLHWTRTEFTLSRSVSQVVMGITGFVIGTSVDRYGARPLMLIGTTVLVISLALHAYVETLLQWVVLNGVVATVGCALVGNLVVNVTMAKWFVEKRGQAVAWAAMGVSFGGVALLPAVTIGIDLLGWREAWIWLGLGVGIVMYPVAMMMRRAPEDHGWYPDGKSAAQVADGQGERAAFDYARSFTRRQALRTLTFYLLVLAFGMFTMNIVVILLQALPYLTDAGFARTEAALAITAASVPAMLSKPFWGYFIDRLAPKPLAALGAAITGLALLLVVWSVQVGALALIYGAFVLLGLGWGGMMPLQEVLWGVFFGRRYLGAVRSAGLPFALVLGAGAPLATSYYHDVTGSYDGALIVVASLNLLAGLLLLLLPEPKTATG